GGRTLRDGVQGGLNGLEALLHVGLELAPLLLAHGERVPRRGLGHGPEIVQVDLRGLLFVPHEEVAEPAEQRNVHLARQLEPLLQGSERIQVLAGPGFIQPEDRVGAVLVGALDADAERDVAARQVLAKPFPHLRLVSLQRCGQTQIRAEVSMIYRLELRPDRPAAGLDDRSAEPCHAPDHAASNPSNLPKHREAVNAGGAAQFLNSHFTPYRMRWPGSLRPGRSYWSTRFVKFSHRRNARTSRMRNWK